MKTLNVKGFSVPGVTFISMLLGSFLPVPWNSRNVGSTVPSTVQSELQSQSFCPVSWTLAEFKLAVSQQYSTLIQEMELARARNQTPESELKNLELVQVLEDLLTEARTALPIESMEEFLLRFYRVSGLTDKYRVLQLNIQHRHRLESLTPASGI